MLLCLAWASLTNYTPIREWKLDRALINGGLKSFKDTFSAAHYVQALRNVLESRHLVWSITLSSAF